MERTGDQRADARGQAPEGYLTGKASSIRSGKWPGGAETKRERTWGRARRRVQPTCSPTTAFPHHVPTAVAFPVAEVGMGDEFRTTIYMENYKMENI